MKPTSIVTKENWIMGMEQNLASLMWRKIRTGQRMIRVKPDKVILGELPNSLYSN